MDRFRISTLGMAMALAGAAGGAVKLASPFADGMVLQRGRAVPVWGTADAGEKVAVSFAGQTRETTADAQGAWRVDLPEMDACKEPRTLTANDAKVADVLVGEDPHFSDRQGRLVAQMTRRPLIRFAYAANYRFSGEPRRTAAYPVAWKPFTPETLGRAPSFSAMGVYFALELQAALDVPVGIVGSYWGGTNIDAWTPRAGYANHPELAETADWKFIPKEAWTDACKNGPINGPQQQPSVLWNEMVAPWCPMAMRGFIWYQGCHNSGESARYCAKMHALYDGWSKCFENPDLKLYFVQLAPFTHSWWGLQRAQAQFAAEEKNAALVTTVDIGNGADVHPNEKGTIGKRLAALALRHDYGFTDIVADAPTVRGVCSEEGRLIVSFDHAKGWYVYQPDWGVACDFEVAGTDGVWKKAFLVNANGGARKAVPWKTRGNVEGRDLILEADGVEKPMKVRYLYNAPWVGTVYADSGLPLGPFEAEVK